MGRDVSTDIPMDPHQTDIFPACDIIMVGGDGLAPARNGLVNLLEVPASSAAVCV